MTFTSENDTGPKCIARVKFEGWNEDKELKEDFGFRDLRILTVLGSSLVPQSWMDGNKKNIGEKKKK